MNLLDNSWLAKLTTFARLIVGFSGGLDSSVLLHVLSAYPELRAKILAIHVNHSLSVHADTWQYHCQKFCGDLKVGFEFAKINLDISNNIEEQARDARYNVFSQFLDVNDCLLLAHHQNDQAETVLFNLLRGAGVDGLSGIPQLRQLGKGLLMRPFLNFKRSQLLSYANLHNLRWIEDESNNDLSFARNYLRQEVLPLILAKWPCALANIDVCTKNLASARANLQDLAVIDCPDIFSKLAELNLSKIYLLKRERLINILRVWFEYNQVLSPNRQTYLRIIAEVIYAGADKIPKLCFSGVELRRYQDILYIVKASRVKYLDLHWKNFPDPLYLEDGRVIYAQPDAKGVGIGDFSDVLVKFRHGGELIRYNGQTKKLKKLLQEFRILPWQRDKLPLLFVNNQLRAVIGLLYADNYQQDTAVVKYKFNIGE